MKILTTSLTIFIFNLMPISTIAQIEGEILTAEQCLVYLGAFDKNWNQFTETYWYNYRYLNQCTEEIRISWICGSSGSKSIEGGETVNIWASCGMAPEITNVRFRNQESTSGSSGKSPVSGSNRSSSNNTSSYESVMRQKQIQEQQRELQRQRDLMQKVQNQKKFHAEHVAKNNSRYTASSQTSSYDYQTQSGNEQADYARRQAEIHDQRQAKQAMANYEANVKRIEAQERAMNQQVEQVSNLVGSMFDDSYRRQQQEWQEQAERRRREEEREAKREAKEAERQRIANLKKQFWSAIPSATWPKMGETNQDRLYYYAYIQNSNQILVSNIFSISRRNDGSWPYKSDLINEASKQANSQKSQTKLMGYFTTRKAAENYQEKQVEEAIYAYVDVDIFTVKLDFNISFSGNYSIPGNRYNDPWSSAGDSPDKTENPSKSVASESYDDPWGSGEAGKNTTHTGRDDSSDYYDPWGSSRQEKATAPANKTEENKSDDFYDPWSSSNKSNNENKSEK